MFLRMARIRIARDELAQFIRIWLTVVGIKRPSLLRDLWTRKDEAKDEARRDQARRSLAEHIVDQIHISGFEVTRHDKDAVNLVAERPDECSPNGPGAG